jgi:predicted dinucleotide-binding enzyme
MNIGIVGVGHMAQAMSRLVIKAGPRVKLNHSRGPQNLRGLREAFGIEVNSVSEAATFGGVVYALYTRHLTSG